CFFHTHPPPPPPSPLFPYTTLFRSATCMASNAILPFVMIEQSPPSRLRSATPIGMTYSSSGTSPFVLYNISPSRKQTGLSSRIRSEEHTSELQSQSNLVCRLLLEKK